MRNLQRLAAVATGLALAGAGGATVAAGEAADNGRAEVDVALGGAPGSPTGLGLRVLYKHPDDPDRKPPAITAGAFDLPRGLRIDGSAVPRCEASDEQFRVSGRDACPPESAVGRGNLLAMTGLGAPADPVEADVTVFNGGDTLIELVTFKGTNVMAGIDRLTIRGSTLTAHPPATPGGPPDGRTAVREIKLTIPARRGFITAPPECPADGLWRSLGRFRFNDGGSAAVSATTPCRPAAKRARRLRAKLSVTPNRVRSGQRVRFRFRARTRRAECARGAIVRLGGRRARTNRRGRAAIRVRLRRQGRRAATLSKRGCAFARTWVRVVRR